MLTWAAVLKFALGSEISPGQFTAVLGQNIHLQTLTTPSFKTFSPSTVRATGLAKLVGQAVSPCFCSTSVSHPI